MSVLKYEVPLLLVLVPHNITLSTVPVRDPVTAVSLRPVSSWFVESVLRKRLEAETQGPGVL